MTAQDRYRKAIAIVRDIEVATLTTKSGTALSTEQLLNYADIIMALTGRQRNEPKSGTRKPKAGKPNGAEAVQA